MTFIIYTIVDNLEEIDTSLTVYMTFIISTIVDRPIGVANTTLSI